MWRSRRRRSGVGGRVGGRRVGEGRGGVNGQEEDDSLDEREEEEEEQGRQE